METIQCSSVRWLGIFAFLPPNTPSQPSIFLFGPRIGEDRIRVSRGWVLSFRLSRTKLSLLIHQGSMKGLPPKNSEPAGRGARQPFRCQLPSPGPALHLPMKWDVSVSGHPGFEADVCLEVQETHTSTKGRAGSLADGILNL